MPQAISVQHLSVTLNDHRVLDDISFTVDQGEVVAIIGPNGAGKTTLIKAILQLIPFEGTVSLLGQSPAALWATPSAIGYVPQRLDFDRTMPVTVRELLAIHLLQPDKGRINEALSLVGAEKLRDRRLGVLSGGEFQRVVLALALLNKPEILFLDEPSAGIDVEGVAEVYSIIKELHAQQAMTVILVSHDVDMVFRYATQVLCVNHRLMCSGVPFETLTKENLEALYGDHHTTYAHQAKHHD